MTQSSVTLKAQAGLMLHAWLADELCGIQHHWNRLRRVGNSSSHDVAGQEVKPDLKMSEADLKEVVISVAKRYGWLIHHDLPAQNSRGRWLTNVQGDAGFPDLILLHPVSGRLLAVELKAEKGKLSPLQKRWLMAFDAGSHFNSVWKPSDMEYILYTLSNFQL
jgi:hypothetical protein